VENREGARPLYTKGSTDPVNAKKHEVSSHSEGYPDIPGFKIIFRKMLTFAGFLGVAHLFGRRLSNKKLLSIFFCE
jgi:hypothetical protein